ncbi:MAG: PRD domain-containing protein [Liquorilactobacillus ghanensis]|uniref:PRD domain-containing protein n=1 Tax=Liquorilactobacillus ghanensis TaxID=399370 RepID=UPI0039E8FC63
MRIIKIFNNNVILAEDKNHEKKILSGKGIGYGKSKDDEIGIDNRIELFVKESKNPEWMHSFLNLINEIPFEYILVTRKIINNAEANLRVKFNPFLLISLADHIYFAIFRSKKEIRTVVTMDDVKHIYPAEYKVGIEALKIIEKYIKIKMHINEANFIAIHFVENELYPIDKKVELSNPIIENEHINNLLTIIINNIGYPMHSIVLDRLTIHLRFLLRRSFNKNSEKDRSFEQDDNLYTDIKDKYPQLIESENLITEYFNNYCSYRISKSEKLYLLMHLHQIYEDVNPWDEKSDE